MNADPTDTRYPHLDLGDLIAGATGRPVGDRAREHLAGCEHCRREVTRWDLVADGVRGLAAATPGTAQPARPWRARRRVPAGPWRRALLVTGSAVAALVLFVGVGEAAGFVHVNVALPGSGTGTALTAVSGCSRLVLAHGTLERVNGSSLVVKTASGRPVTVTTTGSTLVSMSGPLLSDIADGASVLVRGQRSGRGIAASIVRVGPPFNGVNDQGLVSVQGTVSEVGPAGFTLVTSAGTRIPVTTSGGTFVVIPRARLGQLRDGATVYALGHAGPEGTLSARAVAAVSQLPAGGDLKITSRTHGCSPAVIAAGLVSGG